MHRSASNPPERDLFLFDGACGLCTAAAEWARCGDRGLQLDIVPFQEVAEETLRSFGLSRERCSRRLYTVSRSGRVWGGAFAVNAFLWKRQSGKVLVALLYGVPILLALELLVYEVVARNRGALSRWLGLKPRIRSN